MSNTVDYYLSKGLSQNMAEYLSTGHRRITSVVPNDDYTLTLTFDNGEVRLYDVLPLMSSGSVFAPLHNLSDFRRVYLDEDNSIAWNIDPTVDSNVVWSNKLDLCPDSCYVDSTPLTGETKNV